jgi:transcriptional regulator with XRE-family HTH domain
MTKVMNRLKEFRLKRSAETGVYLSVADVAREIGYSRPGLAYYEARPDHIPTPKMLAALCGFYGVEPGELIGRIEHIVTEEEE